MVREIRENELQQLLRLYLHLHEDSVPEMDSRLESVWSSIIQDPDHHIFVREEDGNLAASCVCVIVPNLTRNIRPYALIENVVTHPDYRKRGFASECLQQAIRTAESADCYKIMLLTGSKDEKVHSFYRNNGFVSTDKTAYTMKL